MAEETAKQEKRSLERLVEDIPSSKHARIMFSPRGWTLHQLSTTMAVDEQKGPDRNVHQSQYRPDYR